MMVAGSGKRGRGIFAKHKINQGETLFTLTQDKILHSQYFQKIDGHDFHHLVDNESKSSSLFIVILN